MTIDSVLNLFRFDSLAMVMTLLVAFISLSVASFASRYMQGDRNYTRFFSLLILMTLSLMLMVSSDHIFLLLMAWGMANLFLVILMVHKKNWKAAYASGTLSAKNFMLGFVCVGLAFLLTYYATGLTSVSQINSISTDTSIILLAKVFLLLGMMTQSAIWPFQGWLISSLNSPTPVSAMMHAGLVNGGGFLLVRFAPLYFNDDFLLTVIFLIGLLTALIGSLWKLMQPDVKRMLACSTMGQMGFMLAQCGLGLFPEAVAHLCWHGLFKAYLFLASGSAAQEKRLDLGRPPTKLSFCLSLICGFFGSYSFAFMSNEQWFSGDTRLFLVMIAFMAGAQLSLQIIGKSPSNRLPIALLFTIVMGGLYGSSVYLITSILAPLNLLYPQELGIIHFFALTLLVLAWLSVLFGQNFFARTADIPPWALRFYVKALNASQPNRATVTSHHNHYKYL